jgi:cytoskeletal protein CcmA (bactofilin family)
MAMFNNNPASQTPQTSGGMSQPAEGLTCIIAKGTLIEGKITTSENMRIDGNIKGEVDCQKRLVMDAGGLVQGDVKAVNASIKGKVEGTIEVSETLHLLESSHIKGDIKARQLKVEEGAKYEGQLRVG